MKKFNAVNTRNGREFVLTFLEDGKVLSFDKEKNKEKEISDKTVKRWFKVGQEIVEKKEVKKAAKKKFVYEYLYRGFSIGCQPKGFIEHDDSFGRFGSVTYDRKLTEDELSSYELKEVIKSRQHSRSEIKKDGTKRNDKFRPKLSAEQALEILEQFHSGVIKAQLARDYEVSYRTITCIVEGIMWKDVFAKFQVEAS